jgi:hypothetical protein
MELGKMVVGGGYGRRRADGSIEHIPVDEVVIQVNK